MKKIIFLLLWSLGSFRSLSACDCMPTDSLEAIKISDWIISGKVIKVQLLVRDNKTNDYLLFNDWEEYKTKIYGDDFIWLHEIEVNEKIKGDFTNNIIHIYSHVQESACGIIYPAGKEVLILAKKKGNSNETLFIMNKFPNIPVAYTNLCLDFAAISLQKKYQWKSELLDKNSLIEINANKTPSIEAKTDSLHILDSLIQAFNKEKYALESDEETAKNRSRTKIEWKETTFDFGTVTTGEKIKHRYYFENKGQQDFYISRVKTSCGCTSPTWSTEAIPPGKTGFVEVLFDTTDRDGDIKKTLNVLGNFEGETHVILTLKGKIIL